MNLFYSKFKRLGRWSLFVLSLISILAVSSPKITFATVVAGDGGGGTGGTSSGSSGNDSSGGCDYTDTTGGCYSACANQANSSNGTCVQCDNGACSDSAATPNADCSKEECDLVANYINPTINLLTLVFGLIAVISIVMGGIQFSTSGGDPQKSAAARGRIEKTIFAIFIYAFLYAFLEFLVPGGIFH
jgi:hypothetical protein